MIPPTLSLLGFHQLALVPSERSGQGFRGLTVLLIIPFPCNLVLSVLMGLGRSGALNAASDKSFSDRKLLGQVKEDWSRLISFCLQGLTTAPDSSPCRGLLISGSGPYL